MFTPNTKFVLCVSLGQARIMSGNMKKAKQEHCLANPRSSSKKNSKLEQGVTHLLVDHLDGIREVDLNHLRSLSHIANLPIHQIY